MARKLGLITVGRSPREDMREPLLKWLPDDVEIMEAGALDGATLDQVAEMAPQGDDYVIVSRWEPGHEVKVAKKHLVPLVQQCIDTFEERGADVNLVMCTGAFPDLTHQKMLVLPQQVIYHTLMAAGARGKLGMTIPTAEQRGTSTGKWRELGFDILAEPLSAYESDLEQTAEAAKKLAAFGPDLVLMDCFGYSEEQRACVREIVGAPTILSQMLVARVLGELV